MNLPMNKFKNRFLPGLLAVLLCTAAFSTTAFAGGPDYEEATEETVVETETIEPGKPLSEDSDSSTCDLLYDKAANKQFITITDRDGNVFYLVIDYDSPVSEDEEQYKTYFLNPVDTDDLAALAEEAETKPVACTCTERCVAGSIDMNCPVCAADMTECAGKEPEPEPVPEPAAVEEPENVEEPAGSMNPTVLVVLAIVLAGIGALAYFKLIKNKPKTKGNADLDDYDYGDDGADGEDDASWESEEEVPETDEPTEEPNETDEDNAD